MSEVTSEQAIAIALGHHRSGRLDQAEALYRQILGIEPNNVHALHSLGILAAQSQRPELAMQLFGRAVSFKPDFAQAHADLGAVFLQRGRNEEAVDAFDRAAAIDPNNPVTHCNRGVALIGVGRLYDAEQSLRQAIALKPDFSEARNNLANVLKDQGYLNEAIEEYRHAITAKPGYFEAMVNLGNALKDNNQLDQAILTYQRAVAIHPEMAAAHNHLGIALKENGQIDESLKEFTHAISLEPDYAEAHNNQAVALEAMGHLDEAVAAFGRAVQFQPQNPRLYSNLGTVLRNTGQLDAAITAFQQMAILQRENPSAFVSLGGVLTERGNLTDAIKAYKRALALDSNNSPAYSNLGTTLKEMGRIDDALFAYRKAIQTDPQNAVAHSNLVYAVAFHPDYDAKKILDEARAWAKAHEQPLTPEIKPHGNDRSSDRRLKIGYVSPDFRGHVVGRNLLPLIMHHDREAFETFFFSSGFQTDKITAKLRNRADHWRESAHMSDEELADQIRTDGIDILVDLTLHMSGSRLLTFARKPAPVQLTYLGYCGTTGLDAIDYRFSDSYMDPPEVDLSVYSEETIRLPKTYWCHNPISTQEPSSIPSARNGFITFGCLNNFAKVSVPAMELWAQIMSKVPDSRLILHALAGEHRQRVQQRFAKHGIDATRIEFIGKQPLEDYARTYDRIDMTLDPFPYGGGITTCDSLWEGVPVITLKGPIAVGRGGVSVLSNVGLTEYIANTPEEYLSIAVRLAEDEAKRIQLRKDLRSMMQASPLLDGKQFAADVESAYRQMWKSWCRR